jgi:curved DNA-binding protein CbpA
MDHDLICQWLQLPKGCWPPDHYQVLGVERRQVTAELVEHQVHERMEIVRRYQLAHPDEATEAMNRLAQAYVCLTDPDSRADYDAAPAFRGRAGVGIGTGAAGADAQAADGVLPLDTRRPCPNPPPAMVDIPVLVLEAEEARTEVGKQGSKANIRAAEREVPTLAPRAEDRLVEKGLQPFVFDVTPQRITAPGPARSARNSNRRTSYRRAVQLRRLLRAWQTLQRTVGDPSWRVTQPAEAARLMRNLAEVDATSRQASAGTGNSAEAGHLVIALARQQTAAATFQELLPGQRQALAKDWHDRLVQLEQFQRDLRRDLLATRKHRPIRRGAARALAYFADRPGLILFLLGLLALQIALCRTLLAR